MTVATNGSGDGTLVGYVPEENIGLEDIDQSDIVMPRITIDHKEALFKDSLSGATFSSLKVVLLGQVKQRLMWASETEDGDKPLCKSPDHQNGFPSVSEDLPRDKRFPWNSSGLAMADFPASAGINGLVTLPCSSCLHKEWDNPNAKTKKPMCDEQFTYPIMYDPDGEGVLTPALFSVQRTGLKPAKTYTSVYAQRGTPMFRNWTTLSLNQLSRGTVVYCVPVFKKAEDTDRAMWDEFAMQLRSARELVRMPPENYDEEPTDGDNTNSPAPVTTPSRPVARPAAAPAPVAQPVQSTPVATATAPVVHTPAPVVAAEPESSDGDDDDLPF